MATPRDQLVQAQQHIRNKEYDQARAILSAMPDNPTAQEWLTKLDAMVPTADNSRAKLQQAREFIRTQQYDQARAILETMPDNPTAQEWIAQLSATAPAAPSSELPDVSPTSSALPDIAPAASPPPAAPTTTSALPDIDSSTADSSASGRPNISMPDVDLSQVGERLSSLQLGRVMTFIRSDTFNLVMIGLVAFAGVFTLIHFVALDWMDVNITNDEDSSDEDAHITALEVWLGTGGEDFTLSLDSDAEEGGFGNVRLVDRFLILIPIAAIGLLAAVFFYWRGMVLSTSQSLTLIFLLSAFLYFSPGIWEAFSTENWNDAIYDNLRDEDSENTFSFASGSFVWLLTQAYATAEQSFVAFFAMIASGISLVTLLVRNNTLSATFNMDWGRYIKALTTRS